MVVGGLRSFHVLVLTAQAGKKLCEFGELNDSLIRDCIVCGI